MSECRELIIDGSSLTIADVVAVARDSQWKVSLADSARSRLNQSRSFVEARVAAGDTMYGINTGFGKLASVRVDHASLEQLQVNLIRSHAAGVGNALPRDIVRAMMLLRANVLARPTSGVRPLLVDTLLALLNQDLIPVVPEQGSVGASGDLAPLSHLALVLMGEGHLLPPAESEGMAASEALQRIGIEPYRFGPKEGLAFINGTQAQTAILALSVHDALVVWHSAVGAAAMSLDALQGTPVPLDPRIHQARPHSGQARTARLMSQLLSGSEIRESHRVGDPRVQDAYSLRCTPQVLGAVWDALQFAERTTVLELNASTDNPLVFLDEAGGGEILSGGNFHGQPVAQALDFMAIALTTLQAISERRVERLVNPDLSDGLPAFLTQNPGLSSGHMMVQITAASLVAESRTLAYPASIGSIPTDANQEDFVPMGMAAAWKVRRILANAALVVAAEYLTAAQGLEFLKPKKSGAGVMRLYQAVREVVPPLFEDRPPGPDLRRLSDTILQGLLAPEVA